MAKAKLEVGKEVESWCTKCKLDLNHTIVAMVDDKPKRVQCLTCEGQHNFKAPGSAAKKKVARKKKISKKVALTIDANVRAKPYAMTKSFRADDVIEHPTMGRGRVSKIRGDKMDVEFEAGARVLIFGRDADA